MPSSQGGRIAHGRCVHERRIAEKASREPHERLAVQGVGLPWRIGDGVGEAVVHLLEPGRVGVAEVGDLHRCDAAREYRQAVSPRVSGQIHENVDGVATHDGGRVIVIETAQVAPSIGALAQLTGDGILAGHVRVAGHREPVPIEIPDEGRDEIRHRVVAQVRRDVADVQAAGRAEVGHRRRRREGRRVLPLPFSMGGEALRCRPIDPVVRVKELVRVRLLVSRIGVQRPREGDQSVGRPALLEPADGEGVLRDGIKGRVRLHRQELHHRLAHPMLYAKGLGERDTRDREIRVHVEGRAQCALGFVVSLHGDQHGAQAVQGAGMARIEADGCAGDRLCPGVVTGFEKQVRQMQVRVDVPGVRPDRLAEGALCIPDLAAVL